MLPFYNVMFHVMVQFMLCDTALCVTISCVMLCYKLNVLILCCMFVFLNENRIQKEYKKFICKRKILFLEKYPNVEVEVVMI